jgi:hypothetical protein
MVRVDSDIPEEGILRVMRGEGTALTALQYSHDLPPSSWIVYDDDGNEIALDPESLNKLLYEE